MPFRTLPWIQNLRKLAFAVRLVMRGRLNHSPWEHPLPLRVLEAYKRQLPQIRPAADVKSLLLRIHRSGHQQCGEQHDHAHHYHQLYECEAAPHQSNSNASLKNLPEPAAGSENMLSQVPSP